MELIVEVLVVVIGVEVCHLAGVEALEEVDLGGVGKEFISVV